MCANSVIFQQARSQRLDWNSRVMSEKSETTVLNPLIVDPRGNMGKVWVIFHVNSVSARLFLRYQDGLKEDFIRNLLISSFCKTCKIIIDCPVWYLHQVSVQPIVCLPPGSLVSFTLIYPFWGVRTPVKKPKSL
jgi:hypothetical protein